MIGENPSDTYKLLYYEIIDDLFSQICNSNRTLNYGVKRQIGKFHTHIAIWKKFEEYKDIALKDMAGQRLDRHKLASCLCGSIIETKPLEGVNGLPIAKNANEIFALCVGLNVIKYYMMHEQTKKLTPKERKSVIHYLKENFNMKVPNIKENICDTQEYRKNLLNALYWSHHDCKYSHKECFHYDIWAYAKIFYHLELYNKDKFEEAYKNCMTYAS